MLAELQEIRTARVLVIDDDPMIRRLLEFQLERAGYEVMLVTRGSAAIEQANLFDPDAVLLDLNLPDMSGDEVLKRFREIDGERRRAIIVLSASPYCRSQTSLADADAVESKPIAPSTLRGRLAALHVPSKIRVDLEAKSYAAPY